MNAYQKPPDSMLKQAVQESKIEHALQELKIEQDSRIRQTRSKKKSVTTPGAIKFRFANHSDLPVLLNIWQTCFHDSEEASAFIFDKLQRPENMLVMLVDDTPASMLSIREFMLTAPTQSHKAVYIYGVATLPEHQNKGYGSMLLENAHILLANRGITCSVLVPAEESLFGYYRKRGYETAFSVNKLTLEAEQIPKADITPLEALTAENFMRVRDARFSDSKMFVCWDEEYLSYIIAESEFYGGGAFCFKSGGKQGCAVCYRDGGTVYVKELGAASGTASEVLYTIKEHFEAESLVVYFREDVFISETNNILPFAMVKWYDDKIKSDMQNVGGGSAYIAHVLD